MVLRRRGTLGNRQTDGFEVISNTRRTSFTSQEHSWYSFLLEGLVDPGVIARLKGLGQLKKMTSSRFELGTSAL
jgi:hypothetical protein